jgi:hypothetical protein
MRWVVPALGSIGLAAAVSGCLATAGSPRPPVSRPPAPAAASIVVRYAPPGTRLLKTSAVPAGACPRLARCRAVRARRSGPPRWRLLVIRTLTCSPDRGGYSDPAAACLALRDLAKLEARRGPNVCMCPVEIPPLPTAIGRIDHRHIAFTLDGCSACGLGGGAAADMHVLMSG